MPGISPSRLSASHPHPHPPPGKPVHTPPPNQALSTAPSPPSPDTNLPLYASEWLLQLELSLSLADPKPAAQAASVGTGPGPGTKPPPPPLPKKAHNRASSLPIMQPAPLLTPPRTPEQPAREGRERPAMARGGSTPPSSFPRAESPMFESRKHTASALTAVPEDLPLPLAQSGRQTPPLSIPEDPFQRPGSSLSLHQFVPPSTSDYPYAHLLGWRGSPLSMTWEWEGDGHGQGEGEEGRELEDEQMWEEERLKAFEWIRLKKVSRRVALAQQVQAIRRRSSSNPEDEEEAETETKEETE